MKMAIKQMGGDWRMVSDRHYRIVVPNSNPRQTSRKEMDQQIAEMIHAYSQAEEFLEAERMERLARMTPEEARAIFDNLCRSWEAAADPVELDRLEPLRIERLVQTRRAFERLAERKGLL